MGKKERHAEKVAQRADLAMKRKNSIEPKNVLGFKAGWGWGKAALGMALRRPIYFGLAHLLLLATLGLIASVGSVAGPDSIWSYSVTIMGFVAMVSGIACCASAAREQALCGARRKAPWSAWIAPWRGDWRVGASAVARSVAGMALILCLGALVQWIQTVRGAGSVEWLVKSWESRALSMATIYTVGLWSVAMAMPAWSVKKMARGLGIMASSPMSMLGLAVFWMLWLAISEIVFIYAINQLMMDQLSFAVAKQSLMGLIVLFVAGMSLPAMAMSAGLASLGLDAEMAKRDKATTEPSVAADSEGSHPADPNPV